MVLLVGGETSAVLLRREQDTVEVKLHTIVSSKRNRYVLPLVSDNVGNRSSVVDFTRSSKS